MKSFSFLIFLLSLFVGTANTVAQNTDIQSLLAHNAVGGVQFYDKAGIVQFYEENNWQPVWTNRKDINKIKAGFAESWQHGLNPDNYLSDFVKGMLNSKDNSAGRDVAISASLVRYGRDMTAMRVPPSEIEQKAYFWRKPLSAYEILKHVQSSTSKAEALESFAPNTTLYKALKAQLVQHIKKYRTQARDEVSTPLIYKATLRAGDIDPTVLLLRARLGVKPVSDPELYDDKLVRAVMKFQTDHGLKPDAIIGKNTIDALNKTRADRIIQIISNMERMRWLEPERPKKYLVVNVPAANLWAIEEGRIIHEMPVVVGRKERETKSFITNVTGVRFNPTWTVPKTIKFEDYLPKLQEDRNYLNDKGVEFIHGYGEGAVTLPPELIDWNSLSEGDVKSIRMVQAAGANNPLGRIRLIMYNEYDIFLHDTNSRSLFSRENRSESSGCVRMSDPKKIAHFVMKDTPGWDYEKIDQVLATEKLRDVASHDIIPVYLLYKTIWLEEQNKLIFGPDIYDKDKALYDVLRKYDLVEDLLEKKSI